MVFKSDKQRKAFFAQKGNPRSATQPQITNPKPKIKVRIGQSILIGSELWKVKKIRKKDEFGIEGVIVLTNRKGQTFEILPSDLKPVKSQGQIIQAVID